VTNSNLSWHGKITLSRSEIAELVDALFEMRDATGEKSGPLEDRLSDWLRKGDQAAAAKEVR
jgi:hypothetical protein